MVSFFADIFNEIMEIPALELHSKKTQGYRNRVSGQFREASSGLLFTSDVSARGVDYPKVSVSKSRSFSFFSHNILPFAI